MTLPFTIVEYAPQAVASLAAHKNQRASTPSAHTCEREGTASSGNGELATCPQWNGDRSHPHERVQVIARQRAGIPDPTTGRLLESKYQPPNDTRLLPSDHVKNINITFRLADRIPPHLRAPPREHPINASEGVVSGITKEQRHPAMILPAGGAGNKASRVDYGLMAQAYPKKRTADE